jgi:hypothetical protein
MPTHRQSPLIRYATWSVPIAILSVGTWWAVAVWLSAAAAAESSAHEALAYEICDRLAAIPPGQPYPGSLAELPLSFPDGGDYSLLDRFEYRSSGTSCTLKTVIVWGDDHREVIVRSFPGNAAD